MGVNVERFWWLCLGVGYRWDGGATHRKTYVIEHHKVIYIRVKYDNGTSLQQYSSNIDNYCDSLVRDASHCTSLNEWERSVFVELCNQDIN